MVHFHDNAAAKLPVNSFPLPKTAQLFTAFEQTEDELRLSKLNKTLAEKSGKEFHVEFYYGEQVTLFSEDKLMDIAECYKNVFNESWGENWTSQSALEEIRKSLTPEPDRTPIVSLLYREDKVVGFCWAFIIDSQVLTDGSSPFSSSQFKSKESVDVAKYWLNQVGKKSKFVSIRELGVIKEYRQDKAPYLCLPVFNKGMDTGCGVVFFRTKISSKAFKWSLGVGFVPLQFFMVDGLLLMQGSIKYAINLLNGLLGSNKRKSQHMILSNINRYLCE